MGCRVGLLVDLFVPRAVIEYFISLILFIRMIFTLVHSNATDMILNEKQIDIYENGKHRIVSLESKGIILYGKYLVTEDKKIFEIEEDRAKLVSKAQKTPTSIDIHNNEIYIADRLGSVYQINCSFEGAGETTPMYLFGSISMITNIKVTDALIVTIDKDSKIRVTDKSHPHRIKKFVLIHSKPLIALEVFSNLIVAGGYDYYVSFYNTETGKTCIFDLVEKKIKGIEDGLPGIEDLARIPNINMESQCIVRKILASRETLLLITNTTLLLLTVRNTEDLSAVAYKGVSSPLDSPIVDGVSTEDGYEVIDEEGRLFTLALDSIKLTKKLVVPNYTHKVDISIANKHFK